MRSVLRAPLLHFFVIGACLFVLYDLMNDRPVSTPPDTIVLTPQAAQTLADRFVATWRRPPNQQELQTIMQAWALEEAAVREALILGLDRDDAAIRQRLSHKLRFLIEAQFTPGTPEDAELQAYAKTHSEDFLRPAVVSFQQVSIAPDLQDEAVTAQLAALNAGADWEGYASSSALPAQLTQTSAALAERTFGNGFGDALLNAPVGLWSGPVTSGYGRHLIRITAHEPASMPAFADIRDQVLRDWQAAERARLRGEADAALLSRYDIVLPHASEVLQ